MLKTKKLVIKPSKVPTLTPLPRKAMGIPHISDRTKINIETGTKTFNGLNSIIILKISLMVSIAVIAPIVLTPEIRSFIDIGTSITLCLKYINTNKVLRLGYTQKSLFLGFVSEA